MGLIPNVVSLILFHHNVAGHQETLQTTVDWEQRRDDWLDVLTAAARVVVRVVSSLVSRRKFRHSVKPSNKHPVGGLCFSACGFGLKVQSSL